MDEILQAVEAQNRAFGEFKSNYESKIERLEAKMHNRPGNAASDTRSVSGPRNSSRHYAVDRNSEEVKNFEFFIRTGEVKATTMDTLTGADGGYTVPRQISDQIESMVLAVSPIRQIARVKQIQTPDYHQIVNLRGTGSGWVGEIAARPATDAPQLADVVPPAGEIYAFPQASQRFVDDSQFDVSAFIIENCTDAFTLAEGVAFVTGDGVNKPKGFLTGATAATADATRPYGTLQYTVSGAAATLLPSSPLTALQQLRWGLNPVFRKNAVWVMNATTLGVLSDLKDAQGRFLITPDLTQSGMLQLLGHPVIEAAAMPDIAAGNFPIAFGDFDRGYLITDRIGVRVLIDPYTNRPFCGFYCTKRVGGIVINSAAIKLLRIST